ncbi:hypothetical protein AB0M80_31405 [Amycolatopsis sp. NPDC051045]|uniref:DUF6923 family protein n=1 Tax=Amycolatopsis sp. NPDC051045 TaxID=3156922 RepID=UPI0034476B8C
MTGARARWAAVLGVAAAVSALLAATGWLAPPASRPEVAKEPAGCTILQAENEHAGAPTTLRLLSLPGGVTKRVTRAGYWINAMGYSAGQDVVYGVADGTRAGRYHGAHAVRIDSAGAVTDLGVIGRAGAHHPVWSPVTGATAGAIDRDRWYVRQGSDLYTVDIEPTSADYLRVVHRTALRPVSLAVGVDDFAFDPADGLLYGVSATSRGGSSVVTVDPASGKVAVVPGLRFPDGGAYGSVVLAPGAVYATANHDGRQRSVIYRLPRDGSGPAVEVATGPPLVSGDAAGCYAEAPPPPSSPQPSSTPPPPPSSPVPSTPPATQSPEPSEPPPPPRPPPVEQPVIPPAVPSPAPAAALPPSPVPTPMPPAPAPPTPASHRALPAKKAEPVAKDTGRRTEEKRRWGLTALLLVLGGGAAVGHVRRHR